jgi:hypothetical protein
MSDSPAPVRVPLRVGQTFPWWLVLALVGLDYFSTLAYLPSIAVEAVRHVGFERQYAPLAALGIVLVTLLGALPVYFYVVGRSPNGDGATGLLDRTVRGWFGKIMVLVVLGFVATDLVITRSLSVSDAAEHIVRNPVWQGSVQWTQAHREEVRSWFPEILQGKFFDYWTEQLVLAVLLMVAGFAFWWMLAGSFRGWFMRFAFVVVAVYLGLTALLLANAFWYVADHPALWDQWSGSLPPVGEGREAWAMIAVTLLAFPQVALGLSGFELSMASAPLVSGRPDDTPERPRGRIRNTRVLMLTAALIMSVFMLASVLATTLLIPEEELGVSGLARHRALAYLAHGGRVAGPEGNSLGGLYGEVFGSLYDLSSALILCLAGASVTLSLRDLVPQYLTRFGMQLNWAARTGATMHLFNIVILVVTVVFRASVSAMQLAYATSVLALLTGACAAALLDVSQRCARTAWRSLLSAPFGMLTGFFLVMAVITMWVNASGLAVATAFLLAVLGTAFASRWYRSTELRFQGFTFINDVSRKRWEEIRELEFQVLVPHLSGYPALEGLEKQVRSKHRLGPDVPIIFVETEVGDASDFLHAPMMEVVREGEREVIRITRCVSVAHVLASLCLEFTHVGRPPEIYFEWSEQSPLGAMLNFLFLGGGNVPWLVHDLIIKNQPIRERRPRVVVG